MVEAKLHLNFCAKLYEIQHESGRLFVHEHPDRATSWLEPSMLKLKNMQDVLMVTADQCAFGLKVKVKVTSSLKAVDMIHERLILNKQNP